MLSHWSVSEWQYQSRSRLIVTHSEWPLDSRLRTHPLTFPKPTIAPILRMIPGVVGIFRPRIVEIRASAARCDVRSIATD